MPKVHQVICVPLLKWCFSRTYVYFWRGGTVRIHSCFINNATSQTFPVKGASVGPSAVAVPRLVTILLLCPTYTGVMAFNNRSHVRHAAVADFDCAPVEYLMQLGAHRKMFVNKLQKFLSYPGFYTFTVWWIKPCDPPRSVPPYTRFLILPTSNVLDILRESTIP